MTLDRLVTSQRVAEHFGVAVGTVRQWVREHRIPFVRPSRRIVRFRIRDVERALNERDALRTPVSAPTSGAESTVLDE